MPPRRSQALAGKENAPAPVNAAPAPAPPPSFQALTLDDDDF